MLFAKTKSKLLKVKCVEKMKTIISQRTSLSQIDLKIYKQ